MGLSGLEQGSLTIVAVLALLSLGVPVAISMITVAAGAMYLAVNPTFAFANLRTLPFSVTSDYTYVVVPMFVLMGVVTSKAGIIADLYNAAHRFMSGMRGGLYMSTILAAAGFGAASGSTVVSASVFTRITLPEMERYKYNLGVAAGCVAASGTLAALIPPSIIMVILAVLTDQSIGALLMAGVIPGLLTAAFYMIGIRIFIIARPDWAPLTGEKFTWREKFQSLNRVWAVALLALIVIGGLYVGLFAPSAAGAVGAAGATLIAAFMGRLSLRDFWDSLLEAARITTVLFLIFIGGLLLSRALVVMGFISEVNGLVELYGMSPAMFITLVIVVYVILGIFIDSVSMMVITMPLLFPMSQALQIDPIWFLVLIIKLATIAEITPPVGLNLFAVLGSAGGKINARQLFVGVLPFVALDVVFVIALVLFPAIATWLPAQMKG